MYTGAGARIVVQHGEHWLRNNGDLAMLGVTVGRLRARWPQARIHVLTSSPALLRAYAPGVQPLGDGRLPSLLAVESIGRLVSRLGPAAVGPAAVRWLHARQRSYAALDRIRLTVRPGPATTAVGDRASAGPAPVRELTLYDNEAAAVRGASLVLAMGGGYVADVDPSQTLHLFGLFAKAIEHGVPTAMVGQGLGPLTDPELVAHAERILPRVDLIGLREGLKGPKLLGGLGVPEERITITGDDAIELAYAVRQPTLGTDVGVCLRVADYSPVAARAKEVVGREVRTMAARQNAALVPLIISEYRAEDRRSTMPLVAGYERVVPPLGRFVTPRAVAARVSRCRVLVTGAYHLAVFALSQGIPVVGLTSSEYYDDKFLGLRDMFDHGLQLIHLDEPDLDVQLGNAIRSLWQQAPELRDGLRRRAVDQIRTSTEFYARIFELVEARQPA
jgi:polysaccharide pyruvyl transferase WcaK-like protein